MDELKEEVLDFIALATASNLVVDIKLIMSHLLPNDHYNTKLYISTKHELICLLGKLLNEDIIRNKGTGSKHNFAHKYMY